MNAKKRLGEMLIEAGIIDETQLKAALGHQRQWGVRLGQSLVDLKLAGEADIVLALSTKFGFPVARLADLEPYALEQALKLLPRDFAVRNNVFPMAADTASLTVAMSDPTNLAVVDEMRFRTGRRVKVCMGGDREVAEAVRKHYPAGAEVEAIALDLDVDEGQTEAVFDPFGGGSKDALEAFFGQAPEGAAAHEPTIAPPPAAAPARPAPAADRRPAQATAARTAPPSAAQKRPTVKVPAPVQPAPAPKAAAPQRGPAAASAASNTRPAPVPAPAPAAAPSSARPASAPAPVRRAPAQVPAPAAPAAGTARPAASPAAPAARPRPALEPVELELEEAGAAPPAASPLDVATSELAPFPEEVPPSEPILATDLAPEGEGEARSLTQQETAILDALERLADGHHAEPDIVKPAQAMAALVRLLLRKHIISELEFLDEFKKK